MKHARLAIILILFALMYLPLARPLVGEWVAVEDYSHGFLIPFISLYLLWSRKDDLKRVPIAPSGTGIIIIAGGVALYLAARIGYQFFLQCFSMLIVLFGIVYAQAGREMAKKTAFPIFYLVFMIPLPQLIYTTITFHLRLLSTKMAYAVLALLGMSATIEGNIINLPTCSLIVANPCSGLRSLVVMSAASLAIGYIFLNGFKKRAILFLSAIALAFIMNTVRLVATALIVDMMELGEVSASIHDAAGFAAMILGLVLLFGISDLLKRMR